MLWDADVDVTLELVKALLPEQFRELSGAAVEPLGEGWDNAAFLVGGAFVFRFPRRAVAAPLVAREIAILPLLAPHLPVPVSAPCFAGKATESYPWPFAGYRCFGGRPLSASKLDIASYERLARQLGTFLRVLHGLDAAKARAAGLPGDEIDRLRHAVRLPKVRDRFDELRAANVIGDSQPYVDFLEAIAPEGPRRDHCVIVHGDLYAKHVFVRENGEVKGIIDWGDLHFGDRAVDLSIAFEMLPPHARDAFTTAYGTIDARTWELARYRAIYHAALVAHYGYRIGDDELLHAGLTGLQFAAP